MQHLQEELEKLNNKMDGLTAELVKINHTLVVIDANWREHMRRTEAAEKQIEVLKDELKDSRDELSKELKPINTHIIQVHTVGLVVAAISLILGIAVGIKELLN